MADPDDDTDPPPDESSGDGDAGQGEPEDRSPEEFDPGARSDDDTGDDRGTDEGGPTDRGSDPADDRQEDRDGSSGDGSDGGADDGPDGDRVEVSVDDADEDDESFGGGADPGEDPHDAGPDAGPEEYGVEGEDRRAESDRPWTDEDSVRSELDRLWEDLEGLEDHVEGRTVSREQFEADMKRYVRWHLRKGHVTGWGPYVVLLYGTGMTLGAFFYLEEVWAILAMIVVWLSTLGLYVLMVILGIGIGGARFAWKYLEKVRSLRSGG